MAARRPAHPKFHEIPFIATEGHSWALIIFCVILFALGAFAVWAGTLLIVSGGIWGGTAACLVGLTLATSSALSVIEGKPEYVLLNLMLP